MSDTILFKNALVVDPTEDTPKKGSLLVQDGKIARKFDDGESVPHADKVIECEGKFLSPGLIDIGVKIGEPGERHKESFKSAGASAAAGGVTTIVARSDTTPAIDTPETLAFLNRRALEASVVNVLPTAALTKGREGREMTEIGFLLDAGAVAFSDWDHVSENTKALSRAYTYAKSLGALVIGHPQEPNLSKGASATSGKFASLRGLSSVSPMAERMGLDRDIGLIEMTGVSYHADQITTARALPALERAKANGLDISAGTSIHHLTLNEFDVADYRTYFKMTPPLRSEADRLALVDALDRGLIDIISSMHTPQDEESKRLPFEAAASGAVGLETLLPAALRLYHAGHITLNKLIAAMTLNPANRLGLSAGRLDIGAPADLCVFDADVPYVLDRTKLHSKSKNTPFDGQRMQGKVIATFVAGAQVFGEV